MLHRCKSIFGIAAIALLIGIASNAIAQRYLHGIIWPEPPVITPGEGSAAPSDAVVLFVRRQEL